MMLTKMDFENFRSPILLRGDAHTAYRDPAVFYHDGTFYFYFTKVETEADGKIFLYLGMTTSRDLHNFTPVCKLSPRDQSLNFSSPGNVVRHQGKFYLCCQTYCRENGEKYGNANSRIWLRESSDLLHWGEPQLMHVKGDEVPSEQMGRMIDPYLIQKPDGEWFCFFKQNGVSFSRSRDLLHWEFCGSIECGENVCVVKDGAVYRMWHSPHNGIGEMISHDLLHWRDTGKLITLGQEYWPWAQGRLTAGFVLDLRNIEAVGKALLFFHGTGPEDEEVIFDQYACIGFAWSDDLQNWQFAR
jgi:hypothetical protein